MKPFVSIIIPLYNGEKVIGDCMDAVLESTYKNFEVLVIDDGSSDSSAQKVSLYINDRIALFRNRRNGGFGKAVNIGMGKAKGEILVLLNMDTIVGAAWLSELIEAIMSEEDIGIAGSKILYMDGHVIQHAGGTVDDIGRSYHIGRGEFDNGQYDKPKDVEYVCGAAIGIKREALQRVGNFDEKFLPLYYEEIDFMIRAKKAGYRTIYAPSAKLRHHECYVINRDKKAFYYISRNRIRLVLKHFSVRRIFQEFIFNEARFFLGLERYKQLELIFAYMYNIINLPGILFSRV